MKSCVRWVSVAVPLMLTVASVCLGDEPGYKPGRASIGGQLGLSTFRLDRILGSAWFGDYSEAAKNRFAFSAQFRYVFTPKFRMQVSPGFSWTDYRAEVPAPFNDVRFPNDHDKGDWLTVMVPVSLQGQFVLRRGQWFYHAGAGPGLYRVRVTNQGEILKDPLTFKLHRGIYWGGSGELGVERFLKEMNSTSVELTLAGHVARSQKDKQFPSGLNSNVSAIELKVGMNYYFDTRILGKKPDQSAKPTAP
jgi:hypothetical protein